MGQREILLFLRENSAECYTIQDIKKEFDINETTAQKCLKKLSNWKFIKKVVHKGKPYYFYEK